MCSPRGRSIAAKPVIIRSFTKAAQPLIPKADHRGAEPLSYSVAHLPGTLLLSLVALSVLDTDGLPDLRRLLAFLMNAHGFGQEASIRANLLGRRDFGGCWPGFRFRRWRGGRRRRFHSHHRRGGRLWSHLFRSAAVAHHGLGRRSRLGRRSCNQRRLHETGLRHSHLTGDRGAGHRSRCFHQRQSSWWLSHFGDDVIRYRRLACIQPPASTRHRHESNRSHSPPAQTLVATRDSRAGPLTRFVRSARRPGRLGSMPPYFAVRARS